MHAREQSENFGKNMGTRHSPPPPQSPSGRPSLVHRYILCFVIHDTWILFARRAVFSNSNIAICCREFKAYFKDPYNYFDWLGLILTLLVIPLRFADVRAQWSVASLGYLFNFLRIFKFSCISRYYYTVHKHWMARGSLGSTGCIKKRLQLGKSANAKSAYMKKAFYKILKSQTFWCKHYQPVGIQKSIT